MAYGGMFIITQLDTLKLPPQDIDVIALPFIKCPDGMLTKGTIVTIPIIRVTGDAVAELELTVTGPPIFFKGWEILCELSNTDELKAVYDLLLNTMYGYTLERRLIARHPFSMGP